MLDSDSDERQKRTAIKDFLSERLEVHTNEPKDGERIAYEIAGLLSYRFLMGIEATDPIAIALDIATRLELPPQHQRGATWEDLEAVVAIIE